MEAVWASTGPGAGIAWAQAQVAEGARHLMAVGGDGTLNELATGAIGMEGQGPNDLALAHWPGGTGQDMALRLGLPTQPAALARALVAGQVRRLDAASARPAGPESSTWAPRLVLNAASAGISAAVLQALGGVPKAWPGTLRYALASLKAIATTRGQPPWAPHLTVDGAVPGLGPLVLAVVALGPTFGGGMQIAPGAQDQDGLLDWVGVPHAPPGRLLRLLPSLYTGQLLSPGRGVAHRRGREVAWTGPAWVEVDGELLGPGGAAFRVLPGALPLWAPLGGA